MSYDIRLVDPVTRETLESETPHQMTGGTYAVGGTTELWLNITYNYASYYYEATDGDPRFAHDEVSEYYADGTNGPLVTESGIRGIYGKSGAESIPMLKDMIERIEAKYCPDGQWIVTERERARYYDENGAEIDDHEALTKVLHGECVKKQDYTYNVSEGPNADYWEATAGNAISPLHKLIAMAQIRPDGVWEGD